MPSAMELAVAAPLAFSSAILIVGAGRVVCRTRGDVTAPSPKVKAIAAAIALVGFAGLAWAVWLVGGH